MHELKPPTKTVLRISQAQYDALNLLSTYELLMFQRTFDNLVELATVRLVLQDMEEKDMIEKERSDNA